MCSILLGIKEDFRNAAMSRPIYAAPSCIMVPANLVAQTYTEISENFPSLRVHCLYGSKASVPADDPRRGAIISAQELDNYCVEWYEKRNDPHTSTHIVITATRRPRQDALSSSRYAIIPLHGRVRTYSTATHGGLNGPRTPCSRIPCRARTTCRSTTTLTQKTKLSIMRHLVLVSSLRGERIPPLTRRSPKPLSLPTTLKSGLMSNRDTARNTVGESSGRPTHSKWLP